MIIIIRYRHLKTNAYCKWIGTKGQYHTLLNIILLETFANYKKGIMLFI